MVNDIKQLHQSWYLDYYSKNIDISKVLGRGIIHRVDLSLSLKIVKCTDAELHFLINLHCVSHFLFSLSLSRYLPIPFAMSSLDISIASLCVM